MSDELLKAIERLHDCQAKYLHTVAVKEIFQDQTAWEGDVHIYKLEGHEDTDTCYAWVSPIEGSEKQKIYAILHIPPVDSPEKAVKASIVSDYRNN